MEQHAGWTPRVHAERQRRRAIRFMALGLVVAVAVGFMLGLVAALASLPADEADALLAIGVWLTVATTAPLITAGLVAFALAPPVSDEDPRVEWWHAGLAVLLVLGLVLATGFLAVGLGVGQGL